MKQLIVLMGALALGGCATKNSLNNEWKDSVAQLQITPVMPLRQTLAPGEVYRYLKRPGSFAGDGQLEPVMAFALDNLKPEKADQRVWPTFSFKGGSNSSVKAASQAAGMLSGQLETDDTIDVTVTKGHARRVAAVDIISELCDIGTDGFLRVKSRYHPHIRASGSVTWNVLGQTYVRDVVYVRIPVEVYFAEQMNVTANKVANGGAGIKIDEAKLKQTSVGVDVALNSDRTVSLVETFPVPMAIGYRALLLRIRTADMRVEEFPEEAGNGFFSGL